MEISVEYTEKKRKLDVSVIKFMDSYITFVKKYYEYIKNPLYVKKGTLLSIDDSEQKARFNSQIKNQQKFKEIILKIREESIYFLKMGLAENNEQEEIYAYDENRSRTLAKRDISN